ncbi:MAG: alpha/beta hydrolase [Clostridia bacterium]|nr:alpha/beta hydrolase [Clostridia bacterium]
MTDEEMKDLIKQRKTLKLTDDERKKQKGCFIDLPCGNTHYEIKGEGEACVLVHGYATPYYIYDKVFDCLVSNGYRVLRYDLLGRGLSERVKTDYTPELFAKQLAEITDKFFPDEPFHLFGTSMGGSVTTAFCAAYPGRAKTLTLLAPAGMDNFEPPFWMKLCAAPVLGNILFSIIGSKVLLKHCAGELHVCPQEERDYYIREFAVSIRYKGMEKCTLSSLRRTILRTDKTTENYKKVAAQDLPMLVVWGENDNTMPIYQMPRMKEICPNAEYHVFDGSGHIFLFDEGERTMAVVLPFLHQNSFTSKGEAK